MPIKRILFHHNEDGMTPRRAALAVAIMFGLPAIDPLSAQTIHLAPLPATILDTTSLLRIVAPAQGSDTGHLLRRSATRLRVAAGQLWIMNADSALQTIELGDRPIAELITQLREKYTGIAVSSERPEVSTSLLSEGTFSFAPPTGNGPRTLVISARKSAPTVSGLLGVGFALNEVRRDPSANRLLENFGVNLDVVGSKQFRKLSLRARIGFRSGEAIAVGNDTVNVEEGSPPAASPQTASVASFVETAEKINLGVHLDYTLRRVEDLLVMLGAEVATTWNGLPTFAFPRIPVDTGLVPVEAVFDEGTVDRVRENLDRVVPLMSILVGPRFVFGDVGEYVFYVQGDLGFAQSITRAIRVRYRIEPGSGGAPPTRTPVALSPVRDPFSNPIWRVGAGVKLAGIVDMRVDALGPLRKGDYETKPLLRVVIGSNMALSK